MSTMIGGWEPSTSQAINFGKVRSPDLVGRRVFVGPAVPDAATLGSLLARLGHYFSHIEPERIIIAIGGELTLEMAGRCLDQPQLPPGFAAESLDRLLRIAPATTFVEGSQECTTAERDSDVLLLWHAASIDEPPWNEIAKHYRQNRTRFDVDWRATRTDAIWFAEAAWAMSRSSRAFDRDMVERFRDRTAAFPRAGTAYLVATGPSARSALDTNMSDGVRIVCNTVILDDELMDHVRPHLVTFADPIFHFGPSTYAAQFQRALARQASAHDFTVVTPERYAGLLADRMPQLADRIVGVRLGTSQWSPNLDLLHQLSVRPYPNILTMMMLPMAASFARDVLMFGFDGRAPDESYFWRHGSSVQLDNELDEIRAVHPGFFDIDYADYYAEHVQALEDMLTTMERRGMRIGSASPSFMRPLRRRMLDGMDPLVVDEPRTASPKADLIISVTPDWVDEYGHFGPWERSARVAASARGYEYRTLASKALEPGNGDAIQAFTHVTLSKHPFDATVFEAELREQLNALANDGHRRHVCFYTADIWHLPALLSIACDHPQTLFAVNLMRSHHQIEAALTDSKPWSDAVRGVITATLHAADSSNVVICIDSDAIADDLHEMTGIRVAVWPMIFVGDDAALRAASVGVPTHTVRVVAPIQTQTNKGVADVLELAERVTDRLQRGEWSLATRLVHPLSPPSDDRRRAARFIAAGGDLIEGSLTDEEYARLLGEAHVIVLPYHRDTFRTRTSAVLLDAIAAGKPSVAVHGTWLGNLVEKHRIGRTYREGDFDGMVRAVERVVGSLAPLTHRVTKYRDEILRPYRPQRLIEFLAAMDAERSGHPPSAQQVADANLLARSLLGVYWDRERQRADDNVRHEVELDDLRRARDERLDVIESLQRTLRNQAWKLDQLSAAADASGSQPGRLPYSVRTNGHSSSNGHIEELRAVTRLLQHAAGDRGVIVDFATGHGSPLRELLEHGWTMYSIQPNPGHIRVVKATTRHDGRPIVVSRAWSRPRLHHADGSPNDSVAEIRELTSITRIDVLNVGVEADAMSILAGVPWERLRPRIVVVGFDDVLTRPRGYVARDVAELLTAYGYQVWASLWTGNGSAERHTVYEYEGEPIDPQSRGTLLGLIDRVPTAEIDAAMSDQAVSVS